ncbi:BadF/BadG/BcrA/BcrD ATPase family protein [Antarctobacter heliothermus]|uniref:Glucosamine kinase n=1 Tax=Antarctobacter heliothermus TaxID=74033 RepID=A0A239C4W3_9RHOB|nr:BadF/BadG/BcrA/BcrD ATPase family protein [Antarctobacter heliothermus]SNS14681.1 glucosamine kinase [Antarctobacter heliothermus]
MVQVSETYLIAVDGGGSGCRAVVATLAGQVLGEGTAGPANATTDLDQAMANVREAIGAAIHAAALSADVWQSSVGHLGLAGALTNEVILRIAAGCGVRRATVSDDLETAAAGALGAGSGVLVSVGTGSVLAARQGGALVRLGGWGLQVSDQASGAWLGRALLERVLLCHDGLEKHSALTLGVLEKTGGTAMSIVRFASTARPADYAKLAPLVVAAPEDAHGRALMKDGAAYLRRALMVLDPAEAAPVCLAGGLGPAYADWLPPEMQERLVAPAGTALDGALQMARSAAERGA